MFTNDDSESDINQQQQQLVPVESHEIGENSLPPGYRFHPTDEEIIIHYLRKKIENSAFTCRAVVEKEFYNFEPSELFASANMGDEKCYFFTKRVRKYKRGLRSDLSRATKEGYWTTSGRDKEISSNGVLVGMKRTLMFYQGRAPNGTKTNWKMHEFRLHDSDLQDWVVCSVLKKDSPKSESGKVTSESLNSSKVLPTADKPVSNSVGVLSSNYNFQQNSENCLEGRSSNYYSYNNDNRWLPPQQVMSAGANTSISSTNFGVCSDIGRFCDYKQLQSNPPALQKPFQPETNLISTIPPYMLNLQPPAISTVPALPPDFDSSGNFGPCHKPHFNASGSFDPHFLPDVHFSATLDPHRRPMPNFSSGWNSDPQYVQNQQPPASFTTVPALRADIGSSGNFGSHTMPDFYSTRNFDPQHMPHFNASGSFDPQFMPDVHFSATLDPHRRSMPNINSGGNSDPQYLQNQQPPASFTTVPALGSDVGSSGNFGSHTMPDFDSTRNFDPQRMPHFDASGSTDPQFMSDSEFNATHDS